ncbi:hypothetical protein [Timonella senegalensis]|uniref:hypothetical protein n=1 Tax=Timonella senegalensis TaxID=1465825 RepID=UPI0028A7FBC2|nr:hypothetical protein [Timonella senegalensis]
MDHTDVPHDHHELGMRPLRGVFLNITLTCLVTLALVIMSIVLVQSTSYAPPRIEIGRAFDQLVLFGPEIADHIGWALGIFIPMQLGFYALIIGKQIAGDPESTAATRRSLGSVAVLMTALLFPSIVSIVGSALRGLTSPGLLLVYLPPAALMFVLASQVERFSTTEAEVQLRARTLHRRALVAQRSHVPAPARWALPGIFLNLLVVTGVGLAAVRFVGGGASGAAGSAWPRLVTAFLTSALFLVAVVLLCLWLYHAKTDRFSKVGAGILLALVFSMFLGVALTYESEGAKGLGAGLLVLLAWTVISAFIPTGKVPALVRDLSLGGSAARLALYRLDRSIRFEDVKIAELQNHQRYLESLESDPKV